MGFFGRFVYTDGAWREVAISAEYLVIDIHDSSIATLHDAPVLNGSSGRCFLGYEPRHYFEDETASQPVDPAPEASRLVSWALHMTSARPSFYAVQSLLAHPDGAVPADVFLEDAAEKLIRLLGISLPPDLAPTA